MKRIALLLTFLSIFLCSYEVNAQESKYILGSSNQYTVSKTFVIKNVGNNSATDLNLKIFIGKENEFPYQKDIEVSYEPKPNNITTDKFGNKIANYQFKTLLPRSNFKVEITRKLIASDIESEIDLFNLPESQGDLSQYQLYLNSEDKIESNNPLIISTAKKLTEGLEDDYNKAKAIFEFVNTYITYDTSESYRNKGAFSALSTKRGVCEEYATLFVALCRASGIPARVVTGYRFEKDLILDEQWKDVEPNGHAWAEFYLEGYGWLPVEATQLYTVNGKKTVYWDGFTGLKSSRYITNGLYNNEGEYFSVSYFYVEGNDTKLQWESVKQLVKLEQSNLAVDEKTKDTPNIINIPQFIDLTNNHWSYNYVNNVYQKSIIKGYADNSFRPGNNISRIEFLVMMSRMLKYLNYQEGSENAYTFDDYPYNHWSKEDYNYLVNCLEKVEPSNGFLAGQAALTRVFKDRLNLNESITREEAVALFDKFLNQYDNYSEAFVDISDSRFKSSILKAYENNFINGYANNYFKPKNSITRSEAAKLFDTYFKINGLD